MKNAECRIGIKLAAYFIVCLLLAGCAGNPEGDRGLSFSLEIETSGQIQGIHYAWSTGGKPVGDAAVVNANGSCMEPGSRVWIQFLPEDFPTGEIPEAFTVSISVLDNRGQEIGAGELTVLRENREEVCFRLEGSEPEGYRLTRTK